MGTHKSAASNAVRLGNEEARRKKHKSLIWEALKYLSSYGSD